MISEQERETEEREIGTFERIAHRLAQRENDKRRLLCFYNTTNQLVRIQTHYPNT